MPRTNVVSFCDQCSVIPARRKDGRRLTILRCDYPESAHFTKDVTEHECCECPRHRAMEPGQPPTEMVPEVPSLRRRIQTWTVAVADWKLKGSPERPEEEVQRIYRTFCAATPHCSWYDPARQMCRGCGCGVADSGHAIFNKIKMATQHCPRKLW